MYVAAIGDWFRDTAFDGSLLLAVPVAFIAGVVSFFSPCVLPLLPGYLSYMTGLSAADIMANGSTGVRGRMVTGTLLFILGFSFVFVAIGGAFGRIGYHLLVHEETVTKVLGVVTIVLGLDLRRRRSVAAARRAGAHGAGRRARRGALAGRAVRARLDAVYRADARCRADAVL